jgi:DNA primase
VGGGCPDARLRPARARGAASPRGRAHPFVATPLTWAEVESGMPQPADVHTMAERLAELGDLMASPG